MKELEELVYGNSYSLKNKTENQIKSKTKKHFFFLLKFV